MQPLGKMPVEKAMALVLNWLAWHAENGQQLNFECLNLKNKKYMQLV